MCIRDRGVFVPIGRMEKADDVPARLSKNEFVFTADAVRGAGGGNVNLGAQRMYDTMKRLEAITRLCAVEDNLEIDHEMWEIYNTESLSAALTKGGKRPEHPIFSMIDKVWAGRNLVEQVKLNLWHRLLTSMKTLLTELKTRANELSLDDLLTELWKAISQSEELPKLLVKRWPIALIDEFQDTDDLQYDIFSKIYGSEGSSCL